MLRILVAEKDLRDRPRGVHARAYQGRPAGRFRACRLSRRTAARGRFSIMNPSVYLQKALLLSKLNLASWLDPHFALACPEAIERLVIKRDNCFRWQGLAIFGGMSIAG